MKRIGFIVVLSFVATVIFSQSWTSSSRLTSTSDIVTIVSRSDANSNIYVFGYFSGTLTSNNGLSVNSFGGRDYFTCKFNSDGVPEWINNIGAVINDDAYGGMYVSPSGEVFITGAYLNYLKYTDNDSIFSTGIADAFICKYSTSGDVIWCKNIGTGADQQRATYLTADTDGNLLLAGFFRDSIRISDHTTLKGDSPLYFNAYLTKLEPNDGNFIWANQIHTIRSSYGLNILNIRAKDDHYIFAGTYTDSIKINNDTLVSENNSFDVILCSTDLMGDINWYKSIHGESDELAYGLNEDDNDNIYIAGHYNSPSLTFESEGEDDTTIYQNRGSYDYFIAQYEANGKLNWAKTNGGRGNDKVVSSELFQNEFNISGYFADTLKWGGVTLTTNGPSDRDMFYGSIDSLGYYRSSNSFGGINNSEEDSRSIFHIEDRLYTVIRSNSELLVLGDSIYTSSGSNFYLVLGVIGCLPITVEQVTLTDSLLTCYGDSTETIEIVASGGFGAPWTWKYSIDNGNTSSDSSIFYNVPAGQYKVVVYDSVHCAQAVDTSFTITQPDELKLVLYSMDNPWELNEVHDGFIKVEAQGGTGDYTYLLQPGDIVQINDGTFYIPGEDAGEYRVTVDDENGCGPLWIDFVIQTGFETKSGLEAKIYPNPTSGLITLEMPFEDPECDLEILNMTGQVVMQRKVYSNGGMINESLDLSNQAKGLYLLRINGEAFQSAIMVK